MIFFDSINNGDWNKWASCYSPSVRNIYLDFVNETSNQKANRGILTVNNVDILSIVKVSNIYATKFYTELLSFLDNEDDYECYQVGINTRVNEDNGYFSNGVSYHIVILVKDNNEWGIGAMYSCPQELLPTNVYMPQGIGWGLITFISEPSTIDVMDENGTIHYNEDFTEFIVNATCNEVGNMGYSDDALKANIMAIKMCGWWAKAGRYREAIGCDIKFGDLI